MASMELWADIYFSSVTLKNAKGPLNVEIVTYCTLDSVRVYEQILSEVISPLPPVWPWEHLNRCF